MPPLQELLSNAFVPWLILAGVAIYWCLDVAGSKHLDDPLGKLQKLFGDENTPRGLIGFAAFLWGSLFVLILGGLVSSLIELVWQTANPEAAGFSAQTANPEAAGFSAQSAFRFQLTRIAGLTAVLGALVALPFTALRLKETRKTNRHNADVLFNDKLHEANNDLHARYQVTERDEKGATRDIWADDIIKRNGAIDRLEALAKERPETTDRIARILSVYLKEMSKEHPPLPYDKDWSWEEIETWRKEINAKKRSDMENAAQVMGRLRDIKEDLKIDLAEVNLQAMRLLNLNFEQADFNHAHLDEAELTEARLNGAELKRTRLNGAELSNTKLNETKLYWAELNRALLFEAELNRIKLSWVELNGAGLHSAELFEAQLLETELNDATLYGTRLNGAVLLEMVLNGTAMDESTDLRDVQAIGSALRSIDLKSVKNLESLLDGSFGDGTVELPEGTPWPEKWPRHELDDSEFFEEWKKFKANPEGYVPPVEN